MRHIVLSIILTSIMVCSVFGVGLAVKNVGAVQIPMAVTPNTPNTRSGTSGWSSIGRPPENPTDQILYFAPPAAVSKSPNRLDVFVTGTDKHVYQTYGDGNMWAQWGPLGSPPGGATSGPAVCSWGKDRLDVFVRGGDIDIYHKSWNPQAGWSGWSSIGAPPGGARSAPAAVSQRPNRIDVFVTGTDMRVYKTYGNGNMWAPWESRGSPPGGATSDPAVCSWSTVNIPVNNRLDVFTRGGDGNYWHISWDDQTQKWSGWSGIGAPPGVLWNAIDPAAVSKSSNRIDVFVAGTDEDSHKCIFRTLSEDGGRMWVPQWESLGGPPIFTGAASSPTACSWGKDRLDIFTRGDDGNIYHLSWTG